MQQRGVPMIKVSVMIKRKQGMSAAEFHRYWKEKHGPLAMRTQDFMSHFSKYVQCHRIEESPSDYDGIVELWADSIDEIHRAFQSSGYKNVIQPDEKNFCDNSCDIVMWAEEVRMKG
jgi:uncharacterized protein (TIGR02118 family)